MNTFRCFRSVCSFSFKKHGFNVPSKGCRDTLSIIRCQTAVMNNNPYRYLHIINTFRNYIPFSSICGLKTNVNITPSSQQALSTYSLFNTMRTFPNCSCSNHIKAASLHVGHPVLKVSDDSAINWEIGAMQAKDKFSSAKKNIADTKLLMKEKMEQVIERENIITIPNLLCISRIVAGPVICHFLLASSYQYALTLFLVAGFTDLIDGYIARNFAGQASKLGSFLDPLADKVLVAPVFLALTYNGLIPWVLTGMIIYRDIALIGMASWVRYQSLPQPRTVARYFDATHATVQLAPTTISKVNTAVQLSLITACLVEAAFHPLPSTAPITALWFITGLTTFTSGVSYIFSNNTYKMLAKESDSG